MKSVKFVMLLVTFILFSCVEKETITQHLQVSLVNKTEKKLLYAVETSEKTDTIVSVGLDSIGIAFDRTLKIEHGFFAFLMSDVRYAGVNMIRETLFNITDTTSYSYYCFTLPQNMNDEDSIFVQHHFSSGNASYEKNGIDYSVLYCTDTILQIMQKDYTMVEKFSEYYNQK